MFSHSVGCQYIHFPAFIMGIVQKYCNMAILICMYIICSIMQGTYIRTYKFVVQQISISTETSTVCVRSTSIIIHIIRRLCNHRNLSKVVWYTYAILTFGKNGVVVLGAFQAKGSPFSPKLIWHISANLAMLRFLWLRNHHTLYILQYVVWRMCNHREVKQSHTSEIDLNRKWHWYGIFFGLRAQKGLPVVHSPYNILYVALYYICSIYSMVGRSIADMIIMDCERNHSMGSPMDGTPPQSEDHDSYCLIKDNWGRYCP